MLVNYRGCLINKECLSTLQQIDKQCKERDLSPITFKGTTPDYTFSMDTAVHTGREIHIISDNPISAIWGTVIPLGLIPWNRYPVQNQDSHRFIYYGKWKGLIDSLHSQGLGEFAWSSFMCASSLEVDRWEGKETLIRKIQSELHRLGLHCGPIDGMLNQPTLQMVRKLGLLDLNLEDILNNLLIRQVQQSTELSTSAYFHVDYPVQVFTSDSIQSVKINSGYKFFVNGTGNVILEFKKEI